MTDEEIYAELALLPSETEIKEALHAAHDLLANAREAVNVAAARYNHYNRLQQLLIENQARGPIDPTHKQISMSQVRGALKRYGLTYVKRAGPSSRWDAGFTIDYQPYPNLAHFDWVSVRYRPRATDSRQNANVDNSFGSIQRERLNQLRVQLQKDFPELEYELTQHTLGYWLLWLGRYKTQ